MRHPHRFKTRLGRWWHCLIHFHRPATTYDEGRAIFMCRDCFMDGNESEFKLRILGEDKKL